MAASQDLPVVVALGTVDPALVAGVLDGHCRFVPDPSDAELSLAAGAIVRADARVDQALLDKAPALRVAGPFSGIQYWLQVPSQCDLVGVSMANQ